MNRRYSPVAALLAALPLSLNLVPSAAVAAAPSQAEVASPMPSLAPMVRRVSPAVVNIATRGTVREQAQHNPLLDDPFFRRFFENPPDSAPRERQFQSAGSGVIIDAKNGYIVTNNHVVENASEITVTLLDNRTFSAKVLGTDEGSDLALLQAKEPNLVEIGIADSGQLEVGDYVVAIGNPFGLQHTVTAGIVSALGRSGINPDGYEDFIQTDASINPGNSGGALVNLRGELVGFNSAILSRSGGNIGIGFAISSNMVRSVTDQLIRYGEVRRGVLGINIYDVTPDIAKEYGLGEASGALVAGVAPGSAAEKAGVRTGDVVSAVDAHVIRNAAELRRTIGMLRVGDKVDLSLLRDGKPLKVTALIAERGAVEAGGGGVTVKSVQEGSPAAQAGLRANDLIVGVGRVPVTSLKAFREASRGASLLLLNVRRGSQILLIPIR